MRRSQSGAAIAPAKTGRGSITDERRLDRYINIRLAALGRPTSRATAEAYLSEFAEPLVRSVRQKNQLLRGRLCPADSRIQSFLDRCLTDVCPNGAPRLPSGTFVATPAGLARGLSFPPDAQSFVSSEVSSYRVPQGVLHNPKSDRRTTKGMFHIAEGGLPVPADKTAVPEARIRRSACRGRCRPAGRSADAAVHGGSGPKPVAASCRCCCGRWFVPGAAGAIPRRRWRSASSRPGSLVSNLDFVESDLRQRRRSVPAGKRCRAGCAALDRPHRLRHPRAAPDAADEEGPGTAARAARPPSASGATACAGETRTSFTTTAGHSRSPAATRAA